MSPAVPHNSPDEERESVEPSAALSWQFIETIQYRDLKNLERFLDSRFPKELRIAACKALRRISFDDISADSDFANDVLKKLTKTINEESDSDILHGAASLLEQFTFSYAEIQEAGMKFAAAIMRKGIIAGFGDAACVADDITRAFGYDPQSSFRILLEEAPTAKSVQYTNDALFIANEISHRKTLRSSAEMESMSHFAASHAVSKNGTSRSASQDFLVKCRPEDESLLGFLTLYALATRDRKSAAELIDWKDFNLYRNSFINIANPEYADTVIKQAGRDLADGQDGAGKVNASSFATLFYYISPLHEPGLRARAFKELEENLKDGDIAKISGGLTALLGFNDKDSVPFRSKILRLLLRSDDSFCQLETVLKSLIKKGTGRTVRLLSAALLVRMGALRPDRALSVAKETYRKSRAGLRVASKQYVGDRIPGEPIELAAIDTAGEVLKHAVNNEEAVMAVDFLREVAADPSRHSIKSVCKAIEYLIDAEAVDIEDVERIAAVIGSGSRRKVSNKIIEVFAAKFFQLGRELRGPVASQILLNKLKGSRAKEVFKDLKNLVSSSLSPLARYLMPGGSSLLSRTLNLSIKVRDLSLIKGRGSKLLGLLFKSAALELERNTDNPHVPLDAIALNLKDLSEDLS